MAFDVRRLRGYVFVWFDIGDMAGRSGRAIEPVATDSAVLATLGRSPFGRSPEKNLARPDHRAPSRRRIRHLTQGLLPDANAFDEREQIVVRRTFIAGNWKMNLTRAEAVALATEIAGRADVAAHVDLAICPPSVYLDAVGSAIKGSPVALGAQNVYFESSGAFTGEISTAMLQDVGCQYVILGHSERRHILGETDDVVNRKAKAALACGLIPIVCVGETLAQREAGDTQKVVSTQFSGSLAELSDEQVQRIVIAYEPVWAIGTGKVATPDQAEAVHADLRRLLESSYNDEVAAAVRLQYGGSVKPDNAVDLLSQENIDGALVGGASLKAESFFGIVAGAPAT